VVPAVEPNSAAAEDLVARVRSLWTPFAVQVTGPSASLVDTKASLFGLLPVAGAIIALITFTVLFLFTGGVVIPLKAPVLNLLSLTTAYGARQTPEARGAGVEPGRPCRTDVSICSLLLHTSDRHRTARRSKSASLVATPGRRRTPASCSRATRRA
jgi:hypothetical protein